MLVSCEREKEGGWVREREWEEEGLRMVMWSFCLFYYYYYYLNKNSSRSG